MCGRYKLSTPARVLRDVFGFVEHPNLPARYNIAPSQEAPVVRQRRQPLVSVRCRICAGD